MDIRISVFKFKIYHINIGLQGDFKLDAIMFQRMRVFHGLEISQVKFFPFCSYVFFVCVCVQCL